MSTTSQVVKSLGKGDAVNVDLEVNVSGMAWCRVKEVGDVASLGYSFCQYLQREQPRHPLSETAKPAIVGRASQQETQRTTDIQQGKAERDPTSRMTKSYPPRARALAHAAVEGDIATVRTLVADGADVNVRDSGGNTPLFEAALFGHPDTVEALLAAGAEVDPRDIRGDTPLLRASQYGYTPIVRLLLAAGADVNAQNGADWTPLMQAAYGGYAETVQTLLDAGASLSATNMFQKTALDLALYRHRTEIVELLKAAEKR
jgi:ankyrin repeat protein